MSVHLLPELSPEQRAVVDGTVRLMESGCPLTTVRDLAENARPPDEALRRKLGDLGGFGLLVPQEQGGGSPSGNGMVDAALLAAERGARLQPGPFVGTSVVTHTLAEAGDPRHADVLAALVSGEAAATWVFDGFPGDRRATALSVREVPGGFALSGTLTAVQDADECRWLLVTTRSGDAVLHLLLPRADCGPAPERAESLDLTRRFWDLRLDDVRVPAAAAVGEPGTAAALAERQVAVAAVLSAAETVGAMDADFRLALEYATTRVAFGRPIGSFQALKHLLADTSLALEMCKGLVAGAAEAVGRRSADSLALAGMARAFVSEQSLDVTHNCFQVFGGIGYTWEHDHHLYMRRIASDAYLFGSPSWHRERLWQQALRPHDRAEGSADDTAAP
jgi:alkylation response protein AidB-like acyl-CoA dehydrogenase